MPSWLVRQQPWHIDVSDVCSRHLPRRTRTDRVHRVSTGSILRRRRLGADPVPWWHKREHRTRGDGLGRRLHRVRCWHELRGRLGRANALPPRVDCTKRFLDHLRAVRSGQLSAAVWTDRVRQLHPRLLLQSGRRRARALPGRHVRECHWSLLEWTVHALPCWHMGALGQCHS